MKIGEPGELLRIYLHDLDEHGGRPLHHAIIEAARATGIAGATVLKSPLGFGRRGETHSAAIVDAASPMSILVEIVDESDKIEALLPRLQQLLINSRNPLITRESLEIIRIGTQSGSLDPTEAPRAGEITE